MNPLIIDSPREHSLDLRNGHPFRGQPHCDDVRLAALQMQHRLTSLLLLKSHFITA
jgi:hypothetical protein